MTDSVTVSQSVSVEVNIGPGAAASVLSEQLVAVDALCRLCEQLAALGIRADDDEAPP